MSEGGGEVEERFRVRVSLERYFSDERALVYMSCARGRPVRALARRLRRAFRLPRPFALLSRGHLLPPDEPLALLHRDDPVQVIPTKWSTMSCQEDNTMESCIQKSEDRSDTTAEDTPPRSPGPAGEDPAHHEAPVHEAYEDREAHEAPVYVGCEDREAHGAPLHEEHEDLQEVKRRALDLLEQYSVPAQNAPRRRRVRRRPRRAPALALAPAPSPSPAPAPAPAPGGVVRNRSSSPRAARRVPALPSGGLGEGDGGPGDGDGRGDERGRPGDES